jgi:hypothetical protein
VFVALIELLDIKDDPITELFATILFAYTELFAWTSDTVIVPGELNVPVITFAALTKVFAVKVAVNTLVLACNVFVCVVEETLIVDVFTVVFASR